MTIDFNDRTKYNSVASIRDAKDGKGEYFFEKEERQEFFFDLLVSGTEEAREVAKLLVKVKDYKKIKKANLNLVGELELLRQKNSLGYRVVNKKWLVDSAIAWLKDLNRIGGSDLPKDKAGRDAKIKEYETEVSKIQGDQAPREKRIITLRSQKMSLEEEKNSLKGIADRWDNVVKVLDAEKNPSAKIVVKGVEKSLNDASLTVDYNDYGNSWGDNYDSNTGLFKKDSDNNEDPSKITGEQLVDAVKKANKFLEDIVKRQNLVHDFTWPASWQGSKVSYFNERRYNNKNNLLTGYKEYGYCYLKVLRDIGVENLKKAVKKSGSSKQTQLEKIAEDMVRYINRTEAITDDVKNSFSYVNDDLKWTSALDRWHESLLTKKLDEYPYKDVPKWEDIFLFMKEVFPPNLNTLKDEVIDLKPSDYLDKVSDSSYLRPSDTSKNGWDDIWIGGFYEIPATALANAGISENSLIEYLRNNPNDTKINAKTKSHIQAEPVSSNWDFKSLTKLWWDVFIPFMNNPDPSSSDYKFKVSDTTYDEWKTASYQNELRFCKTMRSILLDLGLISQVDEFDSYLLEISNMATKGSWINPRDKITKDKRNQGLTQDGGKEITLYKKVESGEIWAGDHDYKNFGLSLSSLMNKSSSRMAALESEISRINQQISLLDEKNAEDQNKIDDYLSKIDLLRTLGDDEGLPTDDKKKKFQELYDKKGSQGNKWHYSEIQRMESLLILIENEISSDEFDKDFKNKQLELKKIVEEVGKINDKIYNNWISFKDGEEGENLTVTETIIKIKKEGSERGVTLEKAKEAYEELSTRVLLTKTEQGYLDKINHAIENPGDYQDKPTSVLTKEKLTELFAFDADDNLKTKWTTSFDGKTLASESDINSIFLNDYGPKNTAKHDKLLAHLVDTGDGFEGKKDEANYKIGTPDEKKTTWKKFIEKGPQVVIKTIVNHEFEDKKVAKRGEMDKKRNSDDQPLKDDVYKKGDDGKYTDDAVKQYMYEEKIGKAHQHNDKKQKENGGNGGDGKEELTGVKSWFLFGKGNYWKPILTYVGILILILGVLAFVFWEKVSEWWNGPAEEEGAGAEEKDGAEIEDK